MVWSDLSPSILLTPFSTCVAFNHTQSSSGVLFLRRKRIVLVRLCRGWRSIQTRVFILFLSNSISLTLLKPQPKSNCVSLFPSSIDGSHFVSSVCLFQSYLSLPYMKNRGEIRIWDPGRIVGDASVWVMDLRLHRFGFCCIGIENLNEGLITLRRQNDIGSKEIWFDDFHVKMLIKSVQELEPIWFILVARILYLHSQKIMTLTIHIYRLLGTVIDDGVEQSVRSNKELWSPLSFRVLLKFIKKISSKEGTVEIIFILNLFVKNIAKSRYLKKILVGKLWCHYVYIPELCLDTLGLQLWFAKIKFSHKMLQANHNREKSNMKLDNNRSYERLASKATLRKASSISLLLYFS